MDEGRRSARFLSELWVGVHGHDETPVLRRGDLSASGIYYETDRAVGEPGAVVWLYLASPDKKRDIELMAHVVRTVYQGGEGAEVRPAAGVTAALASAREDSPELALVDLRMEDGSGLDLVRELAALDATTRIVVLTGYGSIATAVEAVRRGAADYLTKPVDADAIVAALEGRSASLIRTDVVPSLARVEWEHIQRVMHDCDGNISQAARLLGIHRRSLQRKLGKNPVRR